MKKKFSTLASRRARAGILFVSPFLVGLFLFYGFSLIRAIFYSFNKITSSPSGDFSFSFLGWGNYFQAFFVDPKFLKILTTSLSNLVVNFFSIMIFSFFVAVVLNQQFKGRVFARIIFFLPVIIYSGVVGMFSNDMLTTIATNSLLTTADSSQQSANVVMGIVDSLPFDVTGLISIITAAVNQLNLITNNSGVQILILLAGLQTIPISLYEASSIEGATGWENFWKITFPMLSPLLIVCAVYTIIDSFNSLTNPVMYYIYNAIFATLNIGYAAAMSWIYTSIILIIVGIVFFVLNRFVYYENH